MKLTKEDLKRIRRPGAVASVMGQMTLQLLGLKAPWRVRRLRGENNPSCKLTDAQVAAILARRGTCSAAQAAREAGVSRMHVSRIWRGLARSS